MSSDAYTQYLDYLTRLRGFYSVLDNSQYETKITADGTFYYREIRAKQWTRPVPPKFASKQDTLHQLEARRRVLEANRQQVLWGLANSATGATEADLDRCNQATVEIDQLTAQIEQWSVRASDDQVDELKIQRADLVQRAAQLVTDRQSHYTFRGTTLAQYMQWHQAWIQTEDYQQWQDLNRRYYDVVTQLSALDERHMEFLRRRAMMVDFNQYIMIQPPQFDPNSAGPTESLKVVVIQPDLPSEPTLHVPIPKTKIKVPLKTKASASTSTSAQCNPAADKAQIPGFVCNPDSGVWVGVDGKVGQGLIGTQPFDQLKFSAGTDLTRLRPTEPKTKVVIKPKATGSVEQATAPVKPKQVSQLDVIRAVIQETGKPEVIAKLQPANVQPMLQLFTKHDVKLDFPAVRAFLTSQNKAKSTAYQQLNQGDLNAMTLASVMTKIYLKSKRNFSGKYIRVST